MSEDIKIETTYTEEHSLVQQNPQLDAEKEVEARSQPTKVRPDHSVEIVDQRANPGSPQAHDLSTSAAILAESSFQHDLDHAAMAHAASGLPTTLPTIKTEDENAAATMPVMPVDDGVVIDSKAAKAMSQPERIAEKDKFLEAARAFFMRNGNKVTESALHAAFDEAHLMSLTSAGLVAPVSMVDRTYRWSGPGIEAAQPVDEEPKLVPGPLDSTDAAG